MNESHSALEAAAKAAYESYGFQRNFRWARADDGTKDCWRALAAAAIRGYESLRGGGE